MFNNALVRAKEVEFLQKGRSSWQQLVDKFLAPSNPETGEARRKDLEDFRAFVEARNLAEAAEFLISKGIGDANFLAQGYKTHLRNRPKRNGEKLSSSTINRRLSTLRSLVKEARRFEIVLWSLEVEFLKTSPYRDTAGPGLHAVGKMMTALAARNDEKGIRDLAILRLLYDRGLRRGEVVSLDLQDVNLLTGQIAIMGKGRTQREYIDMPEPTKDALALWIQVRGLKSGPLFTNFDRAGKGERLSGTSIWRIVRKAGELIGLPTARPHGIRHTAITAALDNLNGNVREVQKFSRHSDPRTVGLYDDARRNAAGKVSAGVAELIEVRLPSIKKSRASR